MFQNPYVTSQLARDRHNEHLATAERHRLARHLRAASCQPGRRRVISRVLTVIAGLAAALGLFASAAKADVNTTPNQSTYRTATISNCTVYVGDQASSSRYAIGDTTVRCGSHHNIWVYTQLFRNGVLIANSKYPDAYYANATYIHDAATTPIHCGGAASWYTVSWVSVDNGIWSHWQGPAAPWTPSC
jgi:hypothetical protein